MSTGRAVTLNLDLPKFSPFETAVDIGRQDTSGDRHDPGQLAGDAERMRALMERGSPPKPAAAQGAPRPFDLFGGPATAAPPAPALSAASAPGVASAAQALSSLASRLLVAGGSQGRRAVQIRLSDEGLAGVTLDVFEDEGRVVAQFTCALEPARERLAAAAGWLATSLAGRIGRDVLVRVLADDPEDPCPVESIASPGASAPALPPGPLQRP